MAARDLDSTLLAQITSTSAQLAFFVYLNLVGGAVRVWSGNGDVSWSSNTWTGIGRLGNIDRIVDSLDQSDIGVQLVLNYLDDDLRNEFITNDSVGRSASIYLNAMTVSPLAVSASKEIFTGYVDAVEITDAGNTGQLSVRLASELALLRRPHFFTLTDAHQQYLFSGDKGLEFASKMTAPILWGRKPVTPLLTGLPIAPPTTTPYSGYGDQYLFPTDGTYGPPG